MRAPDRGPEYGIGRRQGAAGVGRVMPYAHVWGAYRQRDTGGEECLCGSMNVSNEKRHPQGVREHDEKVLTIEGEEAG